MHSIKGFNSLTKEQKGILVYVDKKHKETLGADAKDEFTVTEATAGTRRGEVIVHFKNGQWLRYTDMGTWY